MSDLGLSRQRIDRVRGRTRDSLVGPTAGAEPMPMPGYQSGLNVTFDARNEQVIVGPGVAVVKGQLVTRQSATNLADDADTWIAAKSAEKHYYVYLRDDGDLKVDVDVPVIDTEQLAYYHPEHNNLRAIGKLWLDTSQKTIFATPRFLRDLNVVLVGASDYTDLSDYQARATGAHLEINYAIQYVNEAFGGGTVLLSPGTFNTSAQIFLASGVTLEGTGAGSTTISHSSTVGITSTSITTVTVKRLRIEASTTITSSNPSILITSGAEASTIEDVTIDATNYRHTSAGGAVIVVDASGLVIARRVTILNAGGAGHALSASNSLLGTMTGRAVVEDCIVEFTAADSTASDRVGINLVANDSIVRNCRVSDNTTSGAGDAVGILVDGDDNHVYGNYVEGITSSGAGTAVGIRVASGELRNRITDNFFTGNDSDIEDNGTQTMVALPRLPQASDTVIATQSEYVAEIGADTVVHDENTAANATWFDVDFSGETGYRAGARFVSAFCQVATVAGETVFVRTRRKGDTLDATADGSFDVAFRIIGHATGFTGLRIEVPLDLNGVAQVAQDNTGSNARRVLLYEPIFTDL